MIKFHYFDQVSIPQSEFCPLGRDEEAVAEQDEDAFQFLSRNSVRWDPGGPAISTSWEVRCFNSSVGILSVGTMPLILGVFDEIQVSIPQSEFCPLGRCRAAHIRRRGESFNSSVGILSVGTYGDCITPTFGRVKTVSIPQSEFCPLGLEQLGVTEKVVVQVSIPQSEFCPLGPSRASQAKRSICAFQFLSRNSVRWDQSRNPTLAAMDIRFNSSVGILSVGTTGQIRP